MMIVLRTILKRCIFHSLSLNSLVFGIFKIVNMMLAARNMKYALIINRYPAPRSMFHCPFAIEYPQVHKGGIKAVAIATPGITVFVLSSLVCPMIPASPPKNAINTSKMLGMFLQAILLLVLLLEIKRSKLKRQQH